MAVARIDVNEAKRLESIEKNLIEKFKQAERLQRTEGLQSITELDDDDSSVSPPPCKSSASELLTVDNAKKLEKLQNKLKGEFAESHRNQLEEVRESEKKYEPITRAIRERMSKDEETIGKLRKQSRVTQLMKFRPRASSTPSVERVLQKTITDGKDQENVESAQNESMKQLMDTKTITLGKLGVRYFPRANDSTFGIWYDSSVEKPKIGCEAITFDYDDIILIRPKARYTGTEGLWRLLTSNEYLDKNMYTEEDWKSYKDILLKTNSLYHRNDPESGRPKASQGTKWKKMIKQIWDEKIASDVDDDDSVSGSGLKLYTNSPIEYKYISNMKELINRLHYIQAQEEAGNNNFHNEKLSVVQFLNDRMEELVNTPRGLKYLVRCLSSLPESVIEGSGLLNDIINKLPFELHAPSSWNFDTYNYCGPGTRINERLAKGDVGINQLDEACKEHDIWYRDHKKAEDRWVADKILQNKAWDRVTSPDADLNERAVGLVTTGGMWLKRKLGMGLGTSGCVYPQ